MDDSADPRPPVPPPARPRPARPAPAAPATGGDGKGEEGDAGPGTAGERRPERESRVARPTPVRASLETREEAPEVPVEETTLALDDGVWTVRVLGRARGGVAQGGVSLLLLGFVPPGAEGPDRETLTVSARLEELSDAHLAEAWSRAAPPRPEAERGTPLYPGATGDRRRGR